MRNLSLLLAVVFCATAVFSVACITQGPAPDDDDDTPAGISCATADEAWNTCAAVTSSPTPAPFCASLAAGSIGADSDWGCIASLLGNWDCATGLPSSLEEFGTCINLNPGGDDDDTAGDDDDTVGDDDDIIGDDDDSVPTGPCNDDTSEPNNGLAEATPVTAGSYTGLVSCTDDEDYYSISVNAGQYLRASFTFVDEEGDIDVKIMDATETSLDSSASSTDNEEVAFLSEASATYYIHVRLFSDSGAAVGNPYDMVVETGTPGAEDCGDSVDNDFDGETDCSDSDCDGNANCLEDCGDGVDNDADGLTDCADSSCDGSAECTCATDSLEENDAWDAARPVASGTGGSNLFVCQGDEDWYEFSTNSPISIDLTFIDEDGDIDCKLYDAGSFDSTASWNTHLGSTCGSTTDNESMTFDPSSWTPPTTTPSATLSGTYYLRIHMFSGSTFSNGYSFTVNY